MSILNLTDDDSPIDEISRIETRIEELAEISELCRKIILVSKAAIAGGVVLPRFMVLGLFGSNQVAAAGSIAVVLAACRTEVLSRVATSGIGRRLANWPGVGRVRGDFIAFDASRWLCPG